MKTIFTLLAFCGLAHAADYFSEVRTTDGKVYKAVKVSRVNEVEIRIMHEDGFATIPLSMLPVEVLRRYGLAADRTAEVQTAEQRKLNDMRAYAEGQAAKGQRLLPELAAPTEEQQQRASYYAKRTGQPIDLCLQAVRVGDWCVAHPQGGTGLDGKHYDVNAVGEQLHLAMQVLGIQPAGEEPAVQPPAPRVPVIGVAAPIAVGRAIESSIDGEFTGFEGDKVFKLLNGQIWQQTDFHYHYHYSYGPQVLIYLGNGGWMMKVNGVEKPVRVLQLR